MSDWADEKTKAIFMEATCAVGMVAPIAQALREARAEGYESGRLDERKKWNAECARAINSRQSGEDSNGKQ